MFAFPGPRPTVLRTGSNRARIVVLLLLAAACSCLAAGNLLTNPSVELDADTDGLPDGWSVHREAVGSLVPEASHGERAARFTEGYVVLSQDLQIEELAGKTIGVRVDAKSADGATFGLFVGYMHVSPDGKKTWRNHRMCWDRPLTAEYATFRLRRRVTADVIGPRLWVAFYRSNRKGTITIDNATLVMGDRDPEEQVRFTRIERDWRYLRKRAQAAERLTEAKAEIAAIVTEVRGVEDACFAGDADVLERVETLERRREALSARVNQLAFPGARVVAAWSEPYSRLAPDEIAPADASATVRGMTALQGEYLAQGIVAASCSPTPERARVTVHGLSPGQFAIVVRKQVFQETWYKKQDELLADPLALLPRDGDAWLLELAPGETAKLYLGIHCLAGPAGAEGTVGIAVGDRQVSRLPFAVTVLPNAASELPAFGNLSCIYTNTSVAAHSPELVAADLGAHGVTMMEFAFPPPCTFGPDGELLSMDFTQQELWLKAYCPHVERMGIFYAPGYNKLEQADGTVLEPQSEPWKRALVSLIGGVLERAAALGYGRERFALWTFDEPHSSTLDASPDESVTNAAKVMQLFRRAFPDLQQTMTLTYYAFPRDVEALAPTIDVVVPHWPYPTSLKKGLAPPDYNPRQVFADKVKPLLEREREKRGMQIWSYHVAGGKSDDVLLRNRAYPIRMVGAGQTGIGHWAYNVPRGSTWDDTDGGGVDYVFVYDGTEDHPANRACNPTRETIVPSIRWEAVRAGIQDARVLLHLERTVASGHLPPLIEADVTKVLETVRAMAADDSRITWEATSHVSREARRLLTLVSSPRP